MTQSAPTPRSSLIEIFLAFLQLVQRRQWFSDATFAEMVALAQSMPICGYNLARFRAFRSAEATAIFFDDTFRKYIFHL